MSPQTSIWKCALLFFIVTTFMNTVRLNAQNSYLLDHRDGKEYKYVQIGEQIWMAENLAYLPWVNPPSFYSRDEPAYYIYDFDSDEVKHARSFPNYKRFGVIYNFAGAQIACPSGWHLPSEKEWAILQSSVMRSIVNNQLDKKAKLKEVGIMVKSRENWPEGQRGDNSSGLNILPAGFIDNGNFKFMGIMTGYWTSSFLDEKFNDGSVRRAPNFVDFRFSERGFDIGLGYLSSARYVRCIKN